MTPGNKGHDKGKDTCDVVSECFSRLPIFRLTGGTEDQRVEFVRRLMVDLTQRSLTGVYLRRGDTTTLSVLAVLVGRYDLVLVNDGAQTSDQPMTVETIAVGALGATAWSLGGEQDWPEFLEGFLGKLWDCTRRTPVWGCVLIGGKSSRMGSPKHLLKDGRGITWLENTIATLQPLVDGIVISGAGALPKALEAASIRLPDIPGVRGPLAGILAAGRWQPLVSWLLVACDMPNVSGEAVSWLLAGRRPGCWGRVPRIPGNDRLEPLLAWYDFRSNHLFEKQLYAGNLRIGETAGNIRMEHPVVPENLCYAWENVNTPEQLQKIRE